jgi:2-succinyl-5-enolpyruvyl-6-hydroxy-3-cyclohexene-1-carboxylate synthase
VSLKQGSAARAFVDELARSGLRHALLSPGSRSTPLALALADEPRISVHVQLDERSAGYSALGCALASGRPAAVVTTSGTAAANLHPAVAEAEQAGVPLLLLTADRPPELRATAANQTIDQVKLFGSSARAFFEAGVPHDHSDAPAYWRSLAAQAMAVARGRPPGPVHVNLAFREPLIDTGSPPPGRPGGAPYTELLNGPTPPSAEALERLGALIAASERGVIVAGARGAAPPFGNGVIELARRCGYVVLAEPPSNLRRGPNACAHHNLTLAHEPFAHEMRPDLVIRIGKHGLARPLSAWLAPDIPQVLIDEHGRWTDPDRRTALIVAADPDLTCAALAASLPGRASSAWLEAWLEADRRAAEAVSAALGGEAVSEPGVARAVAAGLPSGAVLLAGSSMPVRDLDSFMAPRADLTVLANRGANGIDGLVSTAFGAALAHDGPVAALIGDLAFLHDSNGLLLDDRPPCVFIVLNNDGGGIFSFLPQAELTDHFERLFATPHGLDLGALARAYGAEHHLLERASDLNGLLAEAVAAGGVTVIEARTQRIANLELHRRIAADVARALSG